MELGPALASISSSVSKLKVLKGFISFLKSRFISYLWFKVLLEKLGCCLALKLRHSKQHLKSRNANRKMVKMMNAIKATCPNFMHNSKSEV